MSTDGPHGAPPKAWLEDRRVLTQRAPDGKPAVARFFAMTILPQVAAARAVAQRIDNSLMDVPEAAF